MSTEPIEVTDEERSFLKSALTGRVQPIGRSQQTVDDMVVKGWLQPHREIYGERIVTVYTLTDAGRAVARQLGIGGGASPDYVNGGEK